MAFLPRQTPFTPGMLPPGGVPAYMPAANRVVVPPGIGGGRGAPAIPGGRMPMTMRTAGLAGLAANQTPAAVPNQGHRLAVDQLFGVKTRRLVDHRLRTPHRRHVDDKLVKVHAHWTGIPVGTLTALSKLASVEVVTADDDALPIPAVKAPPKNPVNVRAILAPGLQPSDGSIQERHILKRLDVIAANDLSRGRRICAYGGLCAAGKDDHLIVQLKRMIKEQSGMDLSAVPSWYKFLELEYRDAPSTIFFLPAIWELSAPLKAFPQARQETQTKEEEYEEEVGNADALEGATDAEKRIKKKRTVTQKKVVKSITPLKFALANLLDFQVQKYTHNDTVELCTATDALDEFFKREMAERVLRTLRKRHDEAEARTDMLRQRDAEEDNRKRAREEQLEARKKARKDREEELKNRWEALDEGKTDDEKRQATGERQQEIRALREQFREEDRKYADEDAKQMAATLASMEEGPLKANPEVIDAFAYFDRTPGLVRLHNSLPRIKVENVLSCLEEKLTLEEIRRLIAVPGIPETPYIVPYRALALERQPKGADNLAPVPVEEAEDEPAES